MNSLKNILPKLKKLQAGLHKYKLLILSFVVIGIFGLILYRINYFSNLEPSEALTQEHLNSTKRPQLDESVVKKLESLESENVQIKTIFKDARNNPFGE